MQQLYEKRYIEHAGQVCALNVHVKPKSDIEIHLIKSLIHINFYVVFSALFETVQIH